MRIPRCLTLFSYLLLPVALLAQNVDTQTDYQELADPAVYDGPWMWRHDTPKRPLMWGSVDVRYPQHSVPQGLTDRTMKLKAWRGEKVHAQAVLWTAYDLNTLRLVVSPLRNGRHTLPASAVKAQWVRYVMGDEYNRDGSGGCGYRTNKAEWDSVLVADVLDTLSVRAFMERETVRPIWYSVNVPSDAAPGTYRGTISVVEDGEKLSEAQKLNVVVKVLPRILPPARQWPFYLDLWQNPYAVARYYNVPLWSKAHFDRLRPIMQMLADAGQKAVTATIMYQPWNAQTEDPYDSMVSKTKKLDGSWEYDYTVFDRWVSFMTEEMGIDQAINCYTMIPWNLQFDYFDQATNRVQMLKAAPGDQAYEDYWLPFLRHFAQHLREKGWMSRTAIAMDERPMEAMKAAIDVVRKADPELRVTLAGNYHEELQAELQCLSIPYGQVFPDSVLRQRRAKGQVSLVYTCCTERFPNIFTFSPPAEATWTAVHAYAMGYDGYLRWANHSWTADPLRDSRFRLFASGDTYHLYPGPRSSIRFERLLEGLQMCEKARLLEQEYQSKGKHRQLARLRAALHLFTPEGLERSHRTAPQAVQQLQQVLNSTD